VCVFVLLCVCPIPAVSKSAMTTSRFVTSVCMCVWWGKGCENFCVCVRERERERERQRVQEVVCAGA